MFNHVFVAAASLALLLPTTVHAQQVAEDKAILRGATEL